MRRRAVLLGLALGAGALAVPASATIPTVDARAGLRAALVAAGDAAIARLGLPGGFADDPIVRIRLPGGLDRVREGLVEAGLGPLVEDLEARMNSAAESVMPATRPLLQVATETLAIEEPEEILAGADDAATRLLEREAGNALATEIGPVVAQALVATGANSAFDAFVAEYSRLPLMPSISGKLTGHVVDSSLAALFLYMGEQERAIRRDSAARTTELLRALFGGGRA
ncbi:MAG: DUF4197 domain-containing protein [Geminicoccaceae bacterium]